MGTEESERSRDTSVHFLLPFLYIVVASVAPHTITFGGQFQSGMWGRRRRPPFGNLLGSHFPSPLPFPPSFSIISPLISLFSQLFSAESTRSFWQFVQRNLVRSWRDFFSLLHLSSLRRESLNDEKRIGNRRREEICVPRVSFLLPSFGLLPSTRLSPGHSSSTPLPQ